MVIFYNSMYNAYSSSSNRNHRYCISYFLSEVNSFSLSPVSGNSGYVSSAEDSPRSFPNLQILNEDTLSPASTYDGSSPEGSENGGPAFLVPASSIEATTTHFSLTLPVIMELPDEEDDTALENALTRLLNKELSDLISDTFNDQQVFFHNLVFCSGYYSSSFYTHPSFQKLLGDINACQYFEKPNYSLWELFLNLSEFFFKVMAYDSECKEEFQALGQTYQKIADSFSDT